MLPHPLGGSGVPARVLEVNASGPTITAGTASELWEFRHVLTAFVAREIKVRYKQTAIGIGWAFLQPVLAAAIFALFLGRWRASPAALRVIGASTLAGILLYDLYLVAPAFNVLALGAAAMATIAIGALFVAFRAMPWAQAPLRRWRLLHGR